MPEVLLPDALILKCDVRPDSVSTPVPIPACVPAQFAAPRADAWGGGGEIKYFWHRYFGFGIESFALNAKRTQFTLFRTLLPGPGFIFESIENHRVISSVLGTVTVRYPIGCSRFAPYAWAGGGAIFGGGETDLYIPTPFKPFKPFNPFTKHTGSEPEAIGQFGGGLEIRFTHHVGWMTDFSWNAINGANNNFGMVRSGFTFAF